MHPIPGHRLIHRHLDGEWSGQTDALGAILSAAYRVFPAMLGLPTTDVGVRRFAVVVTDLPAIFEISVLLSFHESEVRLLVPDNVECEARDLLERLAKGVTGTSGGQLTA